MNKRIIALLVALLLLASAACADALAAEEEDFSAFAGKRVGVQTGTISGEAAQAVIPDIELSYYNSQADAMMAVRMEKVDAWATDEPVARFMTIENDDLRVLSRLLDTSELAATFARSEAGQALCDRYSAFVDGLWADGTIDAIQAVWFGADDSRRVVMDYEALPDPNGTLRMAVDTSILPFAYVKDGRVVGYDVDIAARFCEASGYRLEVVPMSFDGVLPSVQTGKCDFAACGITITEERAERMLFSVPTYHSGTALVVRVEAPSGEAGTAQDGLASLNGKRIGVQTGSSFDAMVAEKLPQAQLEYYIGKADLVAALAGHKIDAFAVDEPVAQLLMREDDRLTYLSEYLDTLEFAPVFPRSEAGEALRDQFNAFLAELPDGTLDQLAAKWFGEDEAAKTMPDIASLSAENGTLRMATESGYAPFEYVRDGAVVGYDMELAALFCEAGGYGLEIVDMNFDGILPAVQTGKCDFAAAGIGITPERAESVLFSEPNFTGGTVLVVLKDEAGDAAQEAGWRDYNGKRIGVLVGPLMEDAAKTCFPDSEYLLYNSYPDCASALLAGKIDAYLGDEPGLKATHAEQPEIDYIHDRITQNNYAFAFRKNDPKSAALCAELNDFLARSRADGTMQELDDIWFGVDEDRKVVDMSDLTGENGAIRVVTTSTDMPFSYIKDGKNVGYDIDLVVRFCRDRGYALELGDVDFAGRIPAIESGKYDFTTDMNVTPERQEQVLFSDPTSYGGIVLAVLSKDLTAGEGTAAEEKASGTSFVDSIRESFNKTFVREGRWKLFVEGVVTTLLITLLAIVCGTVLGFAVFMLCRKGNVAANLVTRFCLWLVQGMPMVVLLMILYYIIFGSVAISGVLVAVIGFTLTFGAAVFGLLRMGVGAVDSGQYEAAWALGYSDRRTFFRIILPQALPHVLPAYKGEIVGLIKATAIVGYIAVQDLTKMGDIVRSRTYEAFFPLIAVTIIYFVLEGLIGFLVSRITVGFDPKRRKAADILKGVKSDD